MITYVTGQTGSPTEASHVDAVFLPRRRLNGSTYRPRRERREISRKTDTARKWRAAIRSILEDKPTRPSAHVGSRWRRASGREHCDPALSRQAIWTLADGSGRRSESSISH